MNLKKIILEEVEDFQWIKDSEDEFQWIKDIQASHPEYFQHRIEDFIKRFARHWENYSTHFEPIDETYGDLQEVGRIWMDEYGDDSDEPTGSWYLDMLVDDGESTRGFVV